MTKKKILIATGGTGGHIFPALSLAKNLLKKNYDIILTTDKRGLNYLGGKTEMNVEKINSSPLVKKNILTFIKSVLLICYSTLKSIFLLSVNRPHFIIGMGGYSSFPVCIAAAILKIKFTIYENNLIIGKANKYLLNFAEKIFVSYKDLEGIDEKNLKKKIEIGNIIREEIIGFNLHDEPKKKLDVINILVLGGSQGAKIFAEKLPKVFKDLKESGISLRIYQQCQSNQKDMLSKFYKNENIKFEIFNFTNKIFDYYIKSNLVITRSGASALGELINIKIPLIAIPLPTSADNHQFKNAKFYEKKGMCFLLEEKNISENLYELISTNFKDNTKFNNIISNQRQYSDKDVFNKLNFNIEKIIYEKN